MWCSRSDRAPGVLGALAQGRQGQVDDVQAGSERELRKIGKLPTKSEFREYYELIRGGVGRGRSVGEPEQ